MTVAFTNHDYQLKNLLGSLAKFAYAELLPPEIISEHFQLAVCLLNPDMNIALSPQNGVTRIYAPPGIEHSQSMTAPVRNVEFSFTRKIWLL